MFDQRFRSDYHRKSGPGPDDGGGVTAHAEARVVANKVKRINGEDPK